MKAKPGLPLGILLAVLPTLVFLLACQAEARTVVVLSSSPEAGVSVRLVGKNGEVQGVTPWKVSLPPGEYSYTAVAPGYRMNSGTVRIEAGTTTQVVIPPLERAAGMVEVRSNAAVTVYIDGVEVGKAGPDPATWVSYGPFAVGSHTVSAAAALGTQSRVVEVSEQYERKVEFLWGSRLRVTVEPAGIPSVTISVDGRPYTGPVDFDAGRLSSRPFAQVAASAPGYASWEDAVFLRPGEITVVTATLTEAAAVPPTAPATAPEAAEGEVLDAFRRYWDVLAAGYRAMDAGGFAVVMTGRALDVEVRSLNTLKEGGIASLIITATFPITPDVSISSDGQTAEVRALYGFHQVFIQTDGSRYSDSYTISGTFTLLQDQDGEGGWLVADVESEAAAAPAPTPGPGHGGGTLPPAPGPADRNLVAQVILGSMNCTAGPFVWDQELADTLAPFAEEATAVFRNTRTYPDDLVRRAKEAVRAKGGRIVTWFGIGLNYNPAGAEFGMFDQNWPAYVDNPCATGFSDHWAGSAAGLTRIGIAIGTPYWDGGGNWVATMIVAGRP